MGGKEQDKSERAHFLMEEASALPIPDQPKAKNDNPNLGHRERLRARFARGGADALADYELLELFLFRSVPRRDTKPMAKDLLKRFGSLAAVLNAPPARLKEVKGIGDTIALDLQIIAAAAKQMGKAQIKDREVLSSWADVLTYCTATMAHEDREQFRILFLDKKNKLIADEVQQVGTIDHAPVYPREVVKRALELSATAIILLHNHPSGDPSPSRADITMTKTVMEVAAALDIVVHDHIIISRTGHASLRGMGYMD